MWLGGLTNKEEIARESSPLTYVRKQNPPIITIHGDADEVVPYSPAVRLCEALDKAGVTNELYSIKGGGHGQFKDKDNRRGYDAVWQFLRKLNLGPMK
jgi:dipeptidyl aminopeptidase/acylaminoacyl peptidase